MSQTLRELLPYTNLAWQLLATVLLFFGAGYLIDSWLDTGGVFTIILSLAGIIIGLVNVILTANRLHRTKE